MLTTTTITKTKSFCGGTQTKMPNCTKNEHLAINCLASLAHAPLACHTRLHDESKECLRGGEGGRVLITFTGNDSYSHEISNLSLK